MTSTLRKSASTESIGGIYDNEECGLSTICQTTFLYPAEILLLEAARDNSVTNLKVLVKQRKVNVNVSDNMGRTPCHWAAINGNLESLEALTRLRADIKVADKYGMSALLCAAWFGHTKVMIHLIKEDKECITQTNKQGMDILHCATSNNQRHVIEFIGECLINFKFNSKEKRGRNALHLACIKGHKESLDVLLRFAASQADAKDDYGRTPLHYSCKNGRVECADRLLREAVDVGAQDNLGQTPIHFSAYYNHVRIAWILMRQFKDNELNQVTHKCQSALMLAASQGHVEMIELLLSSSSLDMNIQDDHGNTACHLASRKFPGNVDTIKSLLNDGRCHVNMMNQNNQLPLHVAIENGQTAVVDLLVKAGSDVSAKNKTGKNSLSLAIRSDEVSVVDIVIQAERIISLTNDKEYFKKKYQNWSHRRLGDDAFENYYRESLNRRNELIENGMTSHVHDELAEAGIYVVDEENMAAYDLYVQGDVQIVSNLETIAEERESWIDADEHRGSNDESLGSIDLKMSTMNLDRQDEDATAHVKNVFWKISHKSMKHEDWKKLGKHWNFSSQQIKAIQQQFSKSHKHRNHGYRLLMIWYHCFHELHPDDNPTKELYESFAAIGNRKLAGVLQMSEPTSDGFKVPAIQVRPFPKAHQRKTTKKFRPCDLRILTDTAMAQTNKRTSTDTVQNNCKNKLFYKLYHGRCEAWAHFFCAGFYK